MLTFFELIQKKFEEIKVLRNQCQCLSLPPKEMTQTFELFCGHAIEADFIDRLQELYHRFKEMKPSFLNKEFFHLPLWFLLCNPNPNKVFEYFLYHILTRGVGFCSQDSLLFQSLKKTGNDFGVSEDHFIMMYQLGQYYTFYQWCINISKNKDTALYHQRWQTLSSAEQKQIVEHFFTLIELEILPARDLSFYQGFQRIFTQIIPNRHLPRYILEWFSLLKISEIYVYQNNFSLKDTLKSAHPEYDTEKWFSLGLSWIANGGWGSSEIYSFMQALIEQRKKDSHDTLDSKMQEGQKCNAYYWRMFEPFRFKEELWEYIPESVIDHLLEQGYFSQVTHPREKDYHSEIEKADNSITKNLSQENSSPLTLQVLHGFASGILNQFHTSERGGLYWWTSLPKAHLAILYEIIPKVIRESIINKKETISFLQIGSADNSQTIFFMSAIVETIQKLLPLLNNEEQSFLRSAHIKLVAIDYIEVPQILQTEISFTHNSGRYYHDMFPLVLSECGIGEKDYREKNKQILQLEEKLQSLTDKDKAKTDHYYYLLAGSGKILQVLSKCMSVVKAERLFTEPSGRGANRYQLKIPFWNITNHWPIKWPIKDQMRVSSKIAEIEFFPKLDIELYQANIFENMEIPDYQYQCIFSTNVLSWAMKYHSDTASSEVSSSVFENLRLRKDFLLRKVLSNLKNISIHDAFLVMDVFSYLAEEPREYFDETAMQYSPQLSHSHIHEAFLSETAFRMKACDPDFGLMDLK